MTIFLLLKYSGLLLRCYRTLKTSFDFGESPGGLHSRPIFDVKMSIECYCHNKEKTLKDLGSFSHPAPTRRTKGTSIREIWVTLKASHCIIFMILYLSFVTILKNEKPILVCDFRWKVYTVEIFENPFYISK